MADDLIEDARRRRRERRDVKELAQRSGTATAQGCICPPKSEQTCKNPTCPRQDHRSLRQKMKDANR